MRKLTICILFSLAAFTGFSQKVYFIYLQSEAGQPFFVKMNGNIQNSSGSGYLILSKLPDSTCNFTLGFPGNKWVELKFSIVINAKDHGYLLKNFVEKGWGLFDLQTMAVQMPVSGSAKTEIREENKDVSLFTYVLSKATDDPSLIEKPVKPESAEKVAEQVIAENVSEEIAAASGKDTSSIQPIGITEQLEVKKDEPRTDNPEQPAVKAEQAVTPVTEPYQPSLVTKRSESSTTEGFGLVFIDDLGHGISDTIRLLIPDPRFVETVIKEEPGQEKKFLDILPDTVKKKQSR